MILYKNMKAVVGLPDGNTNFFDIIAGVLLGNTFAPYLFIICQDYVLYIYNDINHNSNTIHI